MSLWDSVDPLQQAIDVCPELKWLHHEWVCRWTILELGVAFVQLSADLQRSVSYFREVCNRHLKQIKYTDTTGQFMYHFWPVICYEPNLITEYFCLKWGGVNVLNRMEKHCPNLPTFEVVAFTLYACCFQGSFLILLSNF